MRLWGMKPIWEIRNPSEYLNEVLKGGERTTIGLGAVGSWGTAAKVIGAAGLAATATYALFGSKTNQVQSSQIDQKAAAVSKPFYTIDVKPYGTANIYDAGGTPTVNQTAKTDQTQTVPPPTDYMQIILIGALAIGGLLVLNKFGGKK